MKQSKDEFAKKLMEMAEAYKDVGAALEREKYQKRDEMMAGMLLRVAQELLGRHGGSVNILLNRDDAPVKSQPKKRKAVEASNTDVRCIREIFEQSITGTILQPKNIKGTGIGTRTIAAACRSLVESHVLEKVGAKGYRLKKSQENGTVDSHQPTQT